MKKLLFPFLFCMASITAIAQPEPTDFALTSPDILPTPVVFPGGAVTMSSKFYVTGNDFVFSSGSNPKHATIKYTFTKCDPAAPTGNGADLFTWVKAVTGLSPYTATYTGSSKDTTMYKTVPGDPSFHARYNIVFSNSIVKDSSTQLLREIGFYGIFTDPTDPSVDQTPIDNQSGLSTYSVLPVTAPVKWLSFAAAKLGKTVQLNWATASEENSDYFVAERSADGISFAPLGRIAAQGNTNLISRYSFTDASPLTGTSYYRLQQVSLSGPAEYSLTRQLVYKPALEISVYPNPAADFIQLTGIPQTALLEILDANGQLVIKKQHVGSQQKVSVAALASGLYTIRVINRLQLLYKGTIIKN